MPCRMLQGMVTLQLRLLLELINLFNPLCRNLGTKTLQEMHKGILQMPVMEKREQTGMKLLRLQEGGLETLSYQTGEGPM